MGKFIQFDVSDPFKPKKVSSIRLGGIVGRTPHRRSPAERLNGGRQMVEVSRDGTRIDFSDSLYMPLGRAIDCSPHRRRPARPSD